MDANQEKLVAAARSCIGRPYKYGAKPEDMPNYFDCSSFTQYVFKTIGIDIPRSTLLQATIGKEIPLDQPPAVGDLIFFRGSKGHYDDALFPGKSVYIGHVALYIGENKIIHGAFQRGVVEEIPMETAIKEKGPIVLIKRVLSG